ncbi:hypothetical protein A5773_05635 [Mycobacterium sp. 852014-52450_SCH5900713]|nr:hypothetical protein A5773_05635 [Mycobacterium sp. 852014-52450_SCH5900713]
MRESSASAETTSCTKPQETAVPASIVSPVSRSHAACDAPISAGIKAEWITEGIPTATSGMPNVAPDSAIRRSQHIATSSPPPRQYPANRAMTGTGHSRIDSHRVASRRMNASALDRSRLTISLMSAPPMNAASPAPRSTTTRTSPSPSTARNACVNSSTARVPTMLSRFELVSSMVSTPLSPPTRTNRSSTAFTHPS